MGDRRPLLYWGGLFMGEESEEDEDGSLTGTDRSAFCPYRDGSLRGLPLQGRIAPRFALPRS